MKNKYYSTSHKMNHKTEETIIYIHNIFSFFFFTLSFKSDDPAIKKLLTRCKKNRATGHTGVLTQ